MARRRLQYELRKIKESPLESVSAGPVEESNIFVWRACICGPKGTPYEGGLFRTEITFPTDYPFRPPKVRFETKIYHPNISPNGEICVDILQNEWSPALTTAKVLLSVSSLLACPNPNDPLEPEAADLYKKNRNLYDETSRRWTEEYAQ